jgi:hypothetical protein
MLNDNLVFADKYKVRGSARVVTLKQDLGQSPEIEGKLYNMEYVERKSIDFVNSRVFIRPDWEKSFKELHGSKSTWLDYMIKRKEKEAYAIKKDAGFPTGESYVTAVEMEDIINPDEYLIFIENSIEDLKGLKPKPKTTTKSK